MRQYQVSKYNLYIEDDAGQVFIWNSVRDIWMLVDKSDALQLRNDGFEAIDDDKIKDFVKAGFLVLAGTDETAEVVRKMNFFAEDSLPHYRILTTTRCNAACDYCYEKGTPIRNMSDETAEKIAEFICKHDTKNLSVLEWFGGEPLLNTNVINTICEHLRTLEVNYKSVMESNGSLFDDELISYATELWNLKRVQITFDGVEKKHESIKKFKEGMFHKIVHNIHKLLAVGIKVNIRIIHTGDLKSETELIHYLAGEFPVQDKRPVIYFSPLYKSGKSYERDYVNQMIELNRLLLETNYVTADFLYDMKISSGRCFASTVNGYTISPEGTLYNCSHNMSSEQRTGTIWMEEPENQLRREFVYNEVSEECKKCILFPICQGGCRIAEIELAPMTQCHIFKNAMKEVLLERIKYTDINLWRKRI